MDESGFGQRQVFFDGQQLFAEDLQGLEAFHRTSRWEHNRTLHQPGVGNGYGVAGAKGDREVTVAPGYALDALGREIVLVDRLVDPVPPVAADVDGGPVWFDLTVSYPPDDALVDAETRQGVCAPRAAVRLREQPVLCWVRLVRDLSGRLRPRDPQHARALDGGMAIALARAQVLDCVLAGPLVVTGRRSARPPELPRIACGTSTVTWEKWPAVEPFCLTAKVPTGSGGFRLTPSYSARIEGLHPLVVNGATVFDGPLQIQDEEPGSFIATLAVFVVTGGALAPGQLDGLLALVNASARPGLGWRVTWFGVEG